MIQVRINNQIYDANVSGLRNDSLWENRESKSITLPMDYATAVATFADDVPWSIAGSGGVGTLSHLRGSGGAAVQS